MKGSAGVCDPRSTEPEDVSSSSGSQSPLPSTGLPEGVTPQDVIARLNEELSHADDLARRMLSVIDALRHLRAGCGTFYLAGRGRDLWTALDKLDKLDNHVTDAVVFPPVTDWTME